MADNLNQCVEVSTGKTTAGYGCSRINIGGGSYVMYAHRVAFEQMFGLSAEGKVVMHTCDNPSCVNPFHLRLGSHGDNARDMANKGRHGKYNAAKTHCINGHEFSKENTYTYKGERGCRACRAEAVARYRHA